MAATETLNPHEAASRALKVRGLHAAALHYLDLNPDGFLSRIEATQHLVDTLSGLLGDEPARRDWELLRAVAQRITGVHHGPPGLKTKAEVLGLLVLHHAELIRDEGRDRAGFAQLAQASGGGW